MNDGRPIGVITDRDIVCRAVRRSEVLGGEVVAAVSMPSESASSVH